MAFKRDTHEPMDIAREDHYNALMAMIAADAPKAEIAAFLSAPCKTLFAITGIAKEEGQRVAPVDSARSAQQAQDVMEIVRGLYALDAALAVDVLASDYAVHQFVRNGQGEAVLDILAAVEPRQQARILAANEALFGMLEHGPTAGTLAIVDALDQDACLSVLFAKHGACREDRNALFVAEYRADMVADMRAAREKMDAAPALKVA